MLRIARISLQATALLIIRWLILAKDLSPNARLLVLWVGAGESKMLNSCVWRVIDYMFAIVPSSLSLAACVSQYNSLLPLPCRLIPS
jgi:hypothetical protein